MHVSCAPRLAAGAAAVGIVLAGCGGGSDDEGLVSQPAPDQSSFPAANGRTLEQVLSQASADKLSAAAAKAVREPAAAKLLESDAAIPIGSSAAEFAAFIGAEQKRWTPVIERARIKPD